MLKGSVSKKTKKQKLLAQLHRLKKIDEAKPVTSHQPPPNPISNYQLPKTPPQSDYSHVLSDLRRTFVLTALAICAQVVLWYVVR